VRRFRWPVLVTLLALAPVFRLFTTNRLFFVRDLSLFFWSRHLWIRRTLFSGGVPWWDPHAAGGQSAISDALNQLLMPVTLAIRLLPSDVVSFNLWVALPLPVAALGVFTFLRRRLSARGESLAALDGRSLPAPPHHGLMPERPRAASADAAAAMGACVFALSGPAVSMLNTPNLSWSIAMMPWVLLAVDRLAVAPTVRRTAEVAGMFALQALCGEPMTWASTGVLAAAIAIFSQSSDAGDSARREIDTGTRRARIVSLVTIGLVSGALLAAGQLLPTAMAGVRAHRAALATPDFWSLHPLSLWETLAPHVFGDYYQASLPDLPWMGALNFGRDPFLYSLYLGPPTLLLAVVGASAPRRHNALWIAVALIFLAAALGGYTPVYRIARSLFPPLLYFRFPVKYLLFSVLACAVLAADGWAAIADGAPVAVRWRLSVGRFAALTAVLASLGLVVAVASLAMPVPVARAAYALATSSHLKDPAAGAAFLAGVAPPIAIRVFGLLLAGALLLLLIVRSVRDDQAGRGMTGRRTQARQLLFAVTCADLVMASGGLNPTIAAARLKPPAWYTATAGPQRIYIAGRVRGFMNAHDPDAPTDWQAPPSRTAIAGRTALDAELPMAPSGWGVREALSYDLPYLWPAEYDATVRQFELASPEQRAAFLRRSGVRWCVLPAEFSRRSVMPDGRPLAEVPAWKMRVFECHPAASRLLLSSRADIMPDPPDPTWARDALFDPTLPDDSIRLPSMPQTAGRAGMSAPPAAHFVQDGASTVVVEASLPWKGLLLLRDSYDPSWRAEVDGVAAEIVRANGLYRAVALAPGSHVIRFSYRPSDLIHGLIISGTTALVLLVTISLSARIKRTGRRTGAPIERGFTLVELIIVLAIIAILMAVAFTQYRGMQARGNEASALASLRSVAAAQWQFALTCGNMKYATTLPALGQPIPSTGQAFLSPDLTSAEAFEKSGYQFKMTAKPLDGAPPACNGVPVADGYAATADPVNPGVTGIRYYAVNADRILYEDDQKTFTADLPETGPPAHGLEVK
jgi:prepilin-type N-terminal cleavage/methylation domain-containing protein